jgi:ParB family chromosome partitioning protein
MLEDHAMTSDIIPAANVANRLPIEAIVIGERHRRDLGDIAALARNIDDVGLLHPIVVRPDGVLIAGERRLAACKQLGLREVPVTVIGLARVVHGEYAENFFRKSFTPEEWVDIDEAMRPIEEAAARERQRQHGGTAPGKHSGKVSTSDNGRSRDKIGRIVGVSGRTLEKARAVVKAAREEPEKFGHLVDQMNADGRKVERAYRELRIVRERERYQARAETGGMVTEPRCSCSRRQTIRHRLCRSTMGIPDVFGKGQAAFGRAAL